MEPRYWTEAGDGVTLIYCTIGDFARAVAVVDGTPEEVSKLPKEALKAIKDRLYAVCMERYEVVKRSFEDASAEV